MLLVQVVLENFHFAIHLLAALVFFATFWLYFDAWTLKKSHKDLLKYLGFALLSFSYLVSATIVEHTILLKPFFGFETMSFFSNLTRVVGYGLVALGLFLDPLQDVPEHKEETSSPFSATFFTQVTVFLNQFFIVITPFLTSAIGLLYLRRATVGLERHLKPVSTAFFILAFSDVLSWAILFRSSANVGISQAVAPFGFFWIVQHLVLLVGVAILLHWVFGYLLKRIQTQLFMIFTSGILGIFLLTTISFTFLLLKNIQQATFDSLSTDSRVLAYALESKKSEVLSDAQVIAQNPDVIDAVVSENRKKLQSLTTAMVIAKKSSALHIVSSLGVVLVRGEDPERNGDSLSSDVLVKKAVSGESAVSVVTHDGVLAPDVAVSAAAPIKQNEVIIGAVLVSSAIDDAFVDGIKLATGLDVGIYGGNIRSATTFLAPDGKSRSIGTVQKTPSINSMVLSEGKSYTGSVLILNTYYLSSFVPLKNADNTPVGMFFVGKPEVSLLQTAGKSIEFTFIISVILLVLSVIPAYFVSRYLVSQLK